MRVLALVTDGFGGTGGIARYNQSFLRALRQAGDVTELVVLPRSGNATTDLPPGVVQLPPIACKRRYLMHAASLLAPRRRFDLLFCGHIRMAALAAGMAAAAGRPWWLQVHGIEVWAPPGPVTRRAVRRANVITAVSRYTRRRLLAWAGVDPHRVRVLPPSVDPSFIPGTKPVDLLRRYGVEGRKVLLSVSRLMSSERYKGQDRVIEALPALLARHPEIVFLVGGEGDDRPRLERLAARLGVSGAVRFIGHIAEEELIDHHRMADAFIMPSTGEGFGIVFLEALACGVPAIGGDRDGSTDPLSIAHGHAVPLDRLVPTIEAVLFSDPPAAEASDTVAQRFGEAAFRRQLPFLLRQAVAHP